MATTVLWRDKQFWMALAGALLCWLVLWLFERPGLNWLWPLHNPTAFALLALVYPVTEEIVFRGLLQERLHQYLKPRQLGPLSLANLITSLLFTALHLLYHPPLWAALIIIPSLVFGYFRDRHQSLTAPIALHVFYNGGYYWLFAPF